MKSITKIRQCLQKIPGVICAFDPENNKAGNEDEAVPFWLLPEMTESVLCDDSNAAFDNSESESMAELEPIFEYGSLAEIERQVKALYSGPQKLDS